VIAHDLEDRPLSVESMILLELLLKEIGPYVLWNLVVLIYPVTELVSELADTARRMTATRGSAIMVVPHMDEFYDFLQMDQEYVLSRTSWS
jgi:hypothetical protein